MEITIIKDQLTPIIVICGSINHHLIGQIEIVCLESEAECAIINLNINPQFRGHGYGSQLLQQVQKYVLTNHPHIQILTLDDCSDHFHQDDNIYIKMGFRYVTDGFPEMVNSFIEMLNL